MQIFGLVKTEMRLTAVKSCVYLQVGATVEIVKGGDANPEPIIAIINKVTDQSSYTVG